MAVAFLLSGRDSKTPEFRLALDRPRLFIRQKAEARLIYTFYPFVSSVFLCFYVLCAFMCYTCLLPVLCLVSVSLVPELKLIMMTMMMMI